MGQRLEMFVNDCQTKAEKGVVEAQYDLGLLYSIGKGVPRDYVSAHKWFNLAALRQARAWLAQHAPQAVLAA